MTAALEQIGELIWGPWTAAGIVAAGIWLSIKTGWPQLPRKWWRSTTGSLFRREKSGDGISSFQSVTAALAGSLGTGNIVGVAVALSTGGPGAILWMWLAAVPGMATAYAENVLGIRYRKRTSDGLWSGGPMPYIHQAIGHRFPSVLWAAVCTAASLCIGNLVQVNSIASAVDEAWHIPPLMTGALLAATAAPAILGGAQSVTRLTERLVPFMAVIYLLACIAVIIINLPRLPDALRQIISGAFTPAAAGGGFLGSMLTGIRRGVFTNEAGMGTSVLIHCTADNVTPEEQGQWSVFEVFVDTLLMCTLTALAILVSGADSAASEATMSAEAFRQLFGNNSDSFMALATLLFAFATVVGWSCCGERTFAYLFGEQHTLLYRAIYALLIVPGCVMNTNAVWAVSDIFNALLMLPNLAAVIILWSREPSERRLRSKNRNKPPKAVIIR